MRTLIILGILALGALQVAAHTRFSGSEPNEGAALEPGAEAVVLQFSAPIQLRFSAFSLHYLQDTPQLAPDPANRLAAATPVLDSTRSQVTIPLSDPRRPGWYVLDWQVLADDGHTTKGALRFRIDP